MIAQNNEMQKIKNIEFVSGVTKTLNPNFIGPQVSKAANCLKKILNVYWIIDIC